MLFNMIYLLHLVLATAGYFYKIPCSLVSAGELLKKVRRADGNPRDSPIGKSLGRKTA
jgi:hypothetical protein